LGERTALVTGGAGFIGSHICDALLERGFEVAVIDNLSTGKRQNLPAGVAFHELDIRDAKVHEVLAAVEPRYMFHLAAQMDVRKSVADPAYDADVNIGGTINLLEAGRKSGLHKIIYASTGGAVYGEPRDVPANEDTPVAPLCPYGVSKHTVEHYLELYRKLYGMHYTVLRFPNVYGPRQDPHGEAGVVAIFSLQMLRGEQPRIFGDGSKTRDYTYVGDIVEANMLAIDKADGAILALGRAIEVSDQEIFEGVREAIGSDAAPQYVAERLGEVQRIALDASLAKTVLGWEPKVDLKEGLRRCAEFYRAFETGTVVR